MTTTRTDVGAIATELLGKLDDEFTRVPIYLITRSDAQPGRLEAFTGPCLDLQLESVLREHGRWRARGFCAVLNPALHALDDEWLDVVTHEAGHYLASPVELTKATGPALDQAKARYRPEPFGNHGPKWCRVQMHLAYRRATKAPWSMNGSVVGRPGSATESFSLAAMAEYAVPVGDNYPRGSQLFEVLEHEIRDRADEPIREILRSAPPGQYATVWLPALMAVA